MAQRILGMGDIVSLVEQAQRNIDVSEAEKMAAKIKSGHRFDLNDFRDQIQQIKKMGDMNSLIEKLPAQLAQAAGQVQGEQAETQLRRTEGILNSMTPLERSRPELLKASRKRRIAAGAGVSVQEVNRVLKQFEQMQGMMRHMKKGGMAKMMRAMGGMRGMGGMGGLAASAVKNQPPPTATTSSSASPSFSSVVSCWLWAQCCHSVQQPAVFLHNPVRSTSRARCDVWKLFDFSVKRQFHQPSDHQPLKVNPIRRGQDVAALLEFCHGPAITRGAYAVSGVGQHGFGG